MNGPDDSEAGRLRAVVAAIEDDYKRRIEELEKERVHADAANRAKTEFLSSMSHELRTPINAILGFSQLIEFAADKLSRDQVVDYARQIVSSSRHLIDLIEEVLELSKIESGHVEVTRETFDPRPVIEECLEMLRERAAAADIMVFDDEGLRGAPQVFTDRGHFRQVMLNLLSNAVKYNRAGGVVAVEAFAIARGLIRFVVSDTGEGIAPALQPQIFQPFNRLGRAGGKVEGSGIGLYLTKRLIEEVGGAIGFDSEPGSGSRFWVDFPAGDATFAQTGDHVNAVMTMTADAGDRRFTILHVEDNPLNQRLITEVFSTVANMTLVSTTTAEQGLDFARTLHPDLILMDIDLPGMSGVEALQHLSANMETAGIPVVALTAAATRDDIERGMAAGFNAYLTKPIDLAHMLSVIEHALGIAK